MNEDFLSQGIKLTRSIKAEGPWGKLETETPIEGIIVAIGVAAGVGAIAYGLVKSAYKKMTK